MFSVTNRRFHIHGDNIVECERIFALICSALKSEFKIKVTGPFGSLVCSSFTVTLPEKGQTLEFVYFPGYGRWDQNILLHLRNLGVSLREASDIILTEVRGSSEVPLLALEFSGALPAGNQAWQRSGRAYAVAKGKVPYIYLTELGGFELGTDRASKSARLPNPAVPFSYLSYSLTSHTPALPVYIPSPVATKEALGIFQEVFGLEELLIFLKNLILERDSEDVFECLKAKVLNLVKLLSGSRKKSDSLTKDEWGNLYSAVQGDNSFLDYIVGNMPLNWSKTAYIDGLTESAGNLMALAAKYAVGVTSTNLPLCVIPGNRRIDFTKELLGLYPQLNKSFIQWLETDKHLVICWIMGFKPRGDDARPDRGLPGLTRMLVGETEDMLTVVYGPASSHTWNTIEANPQALIRSNGLWEAILSASDGILVDSSTLNGIPVKNYVKSHWSADSAANEVQNILVNPVPNSFGENDVDTVIHLVFHYLGRRFVFEGLCNPPGGDWSGISLLNMERTLEARWLSLPRVSGELAKRPDHVLQIFGLTEVPLILIIESKDRANSVESNIGKRLIRYVRELVRYSPNAQKSSRDGVWSDSVSDFDGTKFAFVSAAAFVLRNEAEMKRVSSSANCDLTIGVVFLESGSRCDFYIIYSSIIGRIISQFLLDICKGSNVNIKILR